MSGLQDVQELESMEAAVRELQQQARDAATSADRNKKERKAAAEEITKLEALSAELKAQLEKASAAHQQVSAQPFSSIWCWLMTGPLVRLKHVKRAARSPG